jgi:hypothetical protein
MPIATINPATGETLRTFDALTAAQVDEKLQRASDAFARHRSTRSCSARPTPSRGTGARRSPSARNGWRAPPGSWMMKRSAGRG